MAHAAEQQRRDVKAARQAWFEQQLDLDPEQLVFIDETAATTKMARLRGRSPRPLEDDDVHSGAACQRPVCPDGD
jgi:hypothetical protein